MIALVPLRFFVFFFSLLIVVQCAECLCSFHCLVMTICKLLINGHQAET
jgi:hypothetical protein